MAQHLSSHCCHSFSPLSQQGLLLVGRTKFRYSQENEPLGRIALRKYRDRTTENSVL
jgi:hypothetical protein